jgi:monoamine oxidase
MADEEAWGHARQNLVKIFGGSEVPMNATAIMRSNWSGDPFAHGTYSYVTPGTESSYFERFQSVLNDRVYFAGEHTSTTYRSSVHGAYLSGERVATAIIEGHESLTGSDDNDDNVSSGARVLPPLLVYLLNVCVVLLTFVVV